MIGIYKITNLVNNKIYIGSSNDINRRLTDHKWLLNKNKHHSVHLQNAWNKYGSINFKFEIIEECSLLDLMCREQYWLDNLLKASSSYAYFIENGYNIIPKAIKGYRGIKTRESIIKQLRSSSRYNPVLKVDVDGVILERYEMISDIKEDHKTVVYKSIKSGKTTKPNKYGYIREKDYIIEWKPEININGMKGVKNTWTKGKKVYVYDIYGRHYDTFDSLHICATHFNTDASSISIQLDKEKKKNNKIPYLFFSSKQEFSKMIDLKDTRDVIEVYTIFDEFIGYSNFIELSTKLETGVNQIYSVLNGSRKQIKGYKLNKHKDIV